MLNRSSNASCGLGSQAITGCRIALSLMCDDFVEIIVSALSATNTDRVWKRTDSLGTLFRGQREDVVQTAKALCANAYREDVHMSATLTFSKGCPGDVQADYLENIEPIASYPTHLHGTASCEATISFYTFGVNDYMDHIYKVIALMKAEGVMSQSSHYATVLVGSIDKVFETYNKVLAYGEQNLSHYVIETHLSVNSPSKAKELL